MTQRRSRLVADAQIAARLDRLSTQLPQTEVCRLANITEKTLRRILRTGQIDKSQREHVAGRLAQISSLYPPVTDQTNPA